MSRARHGPRRVRRWIRAVPRAGTTLAAGLVLAATGGLRAQGAVEPPPLPDESPYVRVLDHPEEDVLEVVVGPVELPAGGPHLRLPVQLATLPVEGWLHGFTWELRDAEGRPLPDRLLHHVNFIDPDARELFAPIPRRVLAAGRETKRQEMPSLLGYPLREGTRVLVSAMFANPTDTDRPEAYLHVRLFYSAAGERLVDPLEVYPFYLDVMGPVGEKDFPLPPGRSVKSWEGRPAIDGRILAIGGHLHDHGTVLRLEDVTEGEVVWEADPRVNDEGRLVGVPTGKLWWRGGLPVHRDHTYRIYVEYENPLDGPAPDGGMGVLGGILLAPRDAEWPELDRRDRSYAQDLRNTLERPFRDDGHGHGGHGGHGAETTGAGEHGSGTTGAGGHGAETTGAGSHRHTDAEGEGPGGGS